MRIINLDYNSFFYGRCDAKHGLFGSSLVSPGMCMDPLWVRSSLNLHGAFCELAVANRSISRRETDVKRTLSPLGLQRCMI